MLNERGYERETNCSGMLRTSSKFIRAQRVHQTCRICVHANELAAAWADSTSYPTCPVSHKRVNVDMFPPTILHTLICCVLCLEKLAWAFVSNGRAVCSISTKQAFYSLKPPGKSYSSGVSHMCPH